MAARGILDNPAMYAGYTSTPLQCVQDWVNIAMATGVTCTQFHHHLIHMLDRITTRTEKRVFNTLPSTPAVLEYLSEHYGITWLVDDVTDIFIIQNTSSRPFCPPILTVISLFISTGL